MTSPVLMAVDDNPDGLRTLDDALRRRYDHDYLVIGETSPERPSAVSGSCGPLATRWRC